MAGRRLYEDYLRGLRANVALSCVLTHGVVFAVIIVVVALAAELMVGGEDGSLIVVQRVEIGIEFGMGSWYVFYTMVTIWSGLKSVSVRFVPSASEIG